MGEQLVRPIPLSDTAGLMKLAQPAHIGDQAALSEHGTSKSEALPDLVSGAAALPGFDHDGS